MALKQWLRFNIVINFVDIGETQTVAIVKTWQTILVNVAGFAENEDSSMCLQFLTAWVLRWNLVTLALLPVVQDSFVFVLESHGRCLDRIFIETKSSVLLFSITPKPAEFRYRTRRVHPCPYMLQPEISGTGPPAWFIPSSLSCIKGSAESAPTRESPHDYGLLGTRLEGGLV